MMKIVWVRTYDHYDSELRDGNCVVEFIGELISEDATFLRLRHSAVTINQGIYREEFHHILKSAIINRKELTLNSD